MYQVHFNRTEAFTGLKRFLIQHYGSILFLKSPQINNNRIKIKINTSC